MFVCELCPWADKFYLRELTNSYCASPARIGKPTVNMILPPWTHGVQDYVSCGILEVTYYLVILFQDKLRWAAALNSTREVTYYFTTDNILPELNYCELRRWIALGKSFTFSVFTPYSLLLIHHLLLANIPSRSTYYELLVKQHSESHFCVIISSWIQLKHLITAQ